jgi:hypothetical protein
VAAEYTRSARYPSLRAEGEAIQLRGGSPRRFASRDDGTAASSALGPEHIIKPHLHRSKLR